MVHRVDYMGLGSGVPGLNSDLGAYISVLNRPAQIRLAKASPHMSPRSPSNPCLGQLPTMNINIYIYICIHMYICTYISPQTHLYASSSQGM